MSRDEGREGIVADALDGLHSAVVGLGRLVAELNPGAVNDFWFINSALERAAERIATLRRAEPDGGER